MAIKTYTGGTSNSDKITTNFRAGEFACNDGSSSFLVDTDAVEKLQQLRTLFATPININSAYRTSTYNAKVGGSTTSKHLYGKAFDCRLSGFSIYLYAKAAEVAGFKGIIVYDTSNFVHVDTREDSSYMCYYDTKKTTSTFLSTVKYGSDGQDVEDLQAILNHVNNDNLTIDGKFGSGTQTAVKAYQKQKGLTVDGIVGKNTWKKLLA